MAALSGATSLINLLAVFLHIKLHGMEFNASLHFIALALGMASSSTLILLPWDCLMVTIPATVAPIGTIVVTAIETAS